MNYDIGHAFCVGDEPATTIPRVAKYIRHFHLEDIAATRVHHHMIPGDGAIDFPAVMRRAIKGIGCNGWLTIELYPYVEDPDEAASRGLTAASKKCWPAHEPECNPTPSWCGCPISPAALADIMLGLLVTGSLTMPGRWPAYFLLMLASVCLYCGGMAWNDFFDLEQDRRERPDRPIPSGRIHALHVLPSALALVAGRRNFLRSWQAWSSGRAAKGAS